MNLKPILRNQAFALVLTIIAVLLGVAACLLLFLEALNDDARAQPARSCPANSGAPLNPATCQPYGSSGTAAVPGTGGSRSSVQKPKQNAPAPKAPAAPPRISVRK
ncbi:hypothetical protein OG345_42150 (plasmid) [Streptomyces sp. NBC_01220]|uniref:hypothetical protein n=1 Tax=Streptomyces sp. NBC_01220 TaxID=2903781 RepID=UPI00352E4BE1|nr:hypothetical protein OG345_42150 [Streptomyces sp. NBC_01220]